MVHSYRGKSTLILFFASIAAITFISCFASVQTTSFTLSDGAAERLALSYSSKNDSPSTPNCGAPAPPLTPSHCPPITKPNLIISAVDGPKLQHQIFIFMQSLDVALGQEALAVQRGHACPAAPIAVKIIVPKEVTDNLDPGFKSLTRRYPLLEFVGAMPEMQVPVVVRRFQGWADYLEKFASSYNKVLACDLDIVFQRNPFTQTLKQGVELLFYPEWRGFKIGQCDSHQKWFRGCEQLGVLTHEQRLSYDTLDRICAGSVYGTAKGIRTYLRTMGKHLHDSQYHCNDQAMHIHLYYSGIMDAALQNEGLGRVFSVPNEEALLGTVGTTPMVAYNEWSEVLNEMGEVQVAVHQYKHHPMLREIVLNRFGWMAAVGQNTVPKIPQIEVDWNATMKEVERVREWKERERLREQGIDVESESNAGDERIHGHPLPEHTLDPEDLTLEEQKHLLMRYVIPGIDPEGCKEHENMCTCKNDDCQYHYSWSPV